MNTKLLIGLTVKNKTLGEGTVLSCDESYLVVKFPTKESKFSFPSAFANGFVEIVGNSSLQEEIIQFALKKNEEKVNAAKEASERKREEAEAKKREHMDYIQKGIFYSTHAEAINACFGLGFKHFQKAYKIFDDLKISIWFPSIAKRVMGEYVAAETGAGWMNVLADNGATIYEKNVEDASKNGEKRDSYDRLVFAKFDGDEGYNFIGIYRPSGYSEDKGFKYVRIGTKYDLNKMEVVE